MVKKLLGEKRGGPILSHFSATVFDISRGKIMVYFQKNKPYDEVLGAAQFTERTSISCQKLSKVVTS